MAPGRRSVILRSVARSQVPLLGKRLVDRGSCDFAQDDKRSPGRRSVILRAASAVAGSPWV